MIFKAWNGKANEWTFIDNIKKFWWSSSHTIDLDEEGFCKVDKVPFHYDYFFCRTIHLDKRKVSIGSITRENGDEYFMIFEKAYLLNDDGKTIEKLL